MVSGITGELGVAVERGRLVVDRRRGDEAARLVVEVDIRRADRKSVV